MSAVSFSSWFETFSFANKLFTDNEIEHVFIKVLINPFQMTDVDVLIPNPSEELRALELLREKNFEPRRAGRLLHPRKLICKHASGGNVDIYPDAEWNRTIVCDGKEIVSRRVLSEVKGIKAYLPTPEDSFYLIATHAYTQHLTITREEVLNEISLLSKPDFSWDHVHALTKNFGTFDSIYAFLRAINLETSNTVDEDVLSMFSRPMICRYVDRWFKNIKEPKFPLQVPIWLGCIFSSFTHTPVLVGKVEAENLAFDFLSHYMRLVGRK